MPRKYNPQVVEDWLATLPTDPVSVNVLQLAMTTSGQVAKALQAYFKMTTWQRANALYGLAKYTEGYIPRCARAVAVCARSEVGNEEE